MRNFTSFIVAVVFLACRLTFLSAVKLQNKKSFGKCNAFDRKMHSNIPWSLPRSFVDLKWPLFQSFLIQLSECHFPVSELQNGSKYLWQKFHNWWIRSTSASDFTWDTKSRRKDEVQKGGMNKGSSINDVMPLEGDSAKGIVTVVLNPYYKKRDKRRGGKKLPEIMDGP